MIRNKYIWIGFILGALFWVFDSFVDAYLFHERTIIEQIIAPTPSEIWMRSFIWFLLVLIGAIWATITVRKQMEKAIKESEIKYSSLLKSAPDGMVIVNSNGEIEIINEQLEKMTGYTSDDLIGQAMEVLIPERFKNHKQQRDSYLADPKTRLMGGDLDLFVRCKDGSEFPAEISLSPVETDERLIISSSIRDITERKLVEDALQEEHRLLSAIIDVPTDMIYVKDINGRFIRANSTLANYFGKTVEEIIGNTNADLFSTDERVKQTDIEDKEVLSTGESFKYERTDEINGKISTRISTKSPYRNVEGKIIGVIGISRDITDRKQTEEIIIERENQLKEAQRMANMGSWDWDISTNTIHWSDEAYRIYGLSREEEPILTRERIMETIHPDDHDRIYENIDKTVDSGIGNNNEYRIVRPDGSVRFISSRREIKLDRDGNTIGLMGTFNDITERKLAEETVKRYQHIVSSNSDFLSYLDKNFIYQAVNDSYLAAFEKTRDEIIGKHVKEVIGQESYKDSKKYLDQCLSGETAHGISFINLPEKGIRIVDARYDPHLSEDGSVAGIVVSVRDVTEIKQVEEELRENEQLLRSFFDAALVGMSIVSPEMKYIQVNDNLCKILGYSREELLDMKWADITLQDDKEKSIDIHNRVLTGEIDNFSIEKRYVRKDGEIVYAEISTECIRNEDNTMNYYVSFTQDITKRVLTEKEHEKIEQQLFQSRKMEAIGQLTGGIAHDFNNILAGILGYTRLASRLARDDKEGKMANYLNQIQHGSERARDMIKQMMIFSREMPTEHSAQSLPPLVDNTLNLLRPSIPSSIYILTKLPDDLPEVKIDPAQFEQILMNLCINARDAMDGNGNIVISLFESKLQDQVCQSCHEAIFGDFVTLMVEDTGSGIPAETLSQIFNPFYSTKEVGEGTGMGLSMVHGIMHTCGGHIQVATTAEEGTTFYLIFPLAKDTLASVDERLEEGEKEKVEHRHNGGVIMVVDDEPLITDSLSEILKSDGYDVIISSSSEDALKMFRQAPGEVDLVITDQTMPGITGLELAKEILVLRSNIPIILSTGYSERVDKDIAKNVGIKAYLNKPVDIDVLLNKVNELLKVNEGSATTH